MFWEVVAALEIERVRARCIIPLRQQSAGTALQYVLMNTFIHAGNCLWIW